MKKILMITTILLTGLVSCIKDKQQDIIPQKITTSTPYISTGNMEVVLIANRENRLNDSTLQYNHVETSTPITFTISTTGCKYYLPRAVIDTVWASLIDGTIEYEEQEYIVNKHDSGDVETREFYFVAIDNNDSLVSKYKRITVIYN